MLTVQAKGPISNCWTYSVHESSSILVTHCNPLLKDSFHYLKASFCQGLFNSSFSLKRHSRFGHIHHLSHLATSKIWMCQNSLNDEYRSSRNIAISMFKRYRNFIDRGGGDNLKEFIGAGVNAYALGCTDEGLRKELNDLKDSEIEIELMGTYGRSTSLKSKIISEEVNECILWLSIIFITILCTPQPTIVRWSSIPPVADKVALQWRGFCALIANAYYIRGMAWLPVKTLQLEQMAVVGRAEEPSVVASRMQLIFSTLEMGEGFTEELQSKTLEEVVDDYIYKFLNRSMVQVNKVTNDGRVKKFRVHELVREFMISMISKSKDEIFVTRNESNQRLPTRVRSISEKYKKYRILEKLKRHLPSLLLFGFEGSLFTM